MECRKCEQKEKVGLLYCADCDKELQSKERQRQKLETHAEILKEYRRYVLNCANDKRFDMTKLLSYEEYLIECAKLESVMREATKEG